MRRYSHTKTVQSPMPLAPASLFIMIILFEIIGFSNDSYAAIYYVNNSGSPACGNAAGRGTQALPFCTISYALGRMAGGDTVYVRSGTYNENLYIAGPAGKSGANTLIAAYPGDTVLLFGSGVNTGRCKIANTSYITFQGFTITNYNQGLFVDSSSNITIQGCTIHHVGQEGLHVHMNSSFVTIDSCTVHDTRQWQYNGEGIYIGTGDSAPVDNTNNVTVRNSTIYNTTDEGIEFKIGIHHITAEGNDIYNVNLGSDWSQNGNSVGAIEVNNAVGAVQNYGSDPQQVVRNNFIHDVKTAIRAGTGITVYNNVIRNVSGYGIYVDNQSSDSYTRAIYHNTIDAAPANAVFHAGGTQDVRNNIGPATAKNLPAQNGYFVDTASADYHLVKGAAPIDAGDDLTAIVPADKDGVSRKTNGPPDLGAYEYFNSSYIRELAVPQLASQHRRILTGQGIIWFEPVSDEDALVKVMIYAVDGKVMLQKSMDLRRENVVDVSRVSTGIYFVRVEGGEEKTVQKVMIAK